VATRLFQLARKHDSGNLYKMYGLAGVCGVTLVGLVYSMRTT
jgi:hypothetical protein